MAINKVIYGNTTLIDLTEDTVSSSIMLVGGVAHNAAGERIQGGLVQAPVVTDSITWDGTAKTPIDTYDSDHINVSGTTTATNIGSYTFTLSLKDKNNYIWVDDGTSLDKTFTWTIYPKIVEWADGTDAEIAAMLEAHYAGQINIYDYWDVGDERTVSLAAMSATGVGESHAAQNVTMVLMNKGGKTLNTAINGHTTCAFIVGQKHSLNEKGYMNSTHTNLGGWDSCARRTWCNDVYKAAIPSTLRGIFKQHKNETADGSGTSKKTSVDYFALPSEKEVFGSVTKANDTAEANNTQFKYYETSSNRIKNVNGSAYEWWERSPYSGGDALFCNVNSSGNANASGASNTKGVAPFGCI